MVLSCVAVIGACTASIASDSLAVVGVLSPDDACIVSPDNNPIVRGEFDISESPECTASYAVAIEIENPIRGPKPRTDRPDCSINNLQITSARITLLREDESLVDVGDMPNPFTVTTYATVPMAASASELGMGVALVEVIPTAYRPQLRSLAEAGETIIAVMELSGETTGGQSVQLDEYRFPIDLCVGCLTLCRNSLSPEDLADLTAGICQDNSGSDGRLCIVEGC